MHGSQRIDSVLGGKSPDMRRLKHELAAIAPLDSNLLITGETGTGKGRIARLVHTLSPRAAEPKRASDLTANRSKSVRCVRRRAEIVLWSIACLPRARQGKVASCTFSIPGFV